MEEKQGNETGISAFWTVSKRRGDTEEVGRRQDGGARKGGGR